MKKFKNKLEKTCEKLNLTRKQSSKIFNVMLMFDVDYCINARV